MSIMENKEAFYDFLGEYAHFFREMASFEKDKLDVLLGNRLPDIEHAISVTQANAMQLDNLEHKRIRMQDEAGLASMSLSQLAEDAPEASRKQLGELMGELNGYIRDIKFYNTKSMDVVKARLRVQEQIAPREALHTHGDMPAKLSTQA